MRYGVAASFTKPGVDLGWVMLREFDNQTEAFRVCTAMIDSGDDTATYIGSAVGATKIKFDIKSIGV